MPSISPCQIPSNPLLTPCICISSPKDSQILQPLSPLLMSPISLPITHFSSPHFTSWPLFFTPISPPCPFSHLFLLIPITPHTHFSQLFLTPFLLTPISPHPHLSSPTFLRASRGASSLPPAFPSESGWDTHAKKGSSSKLLLNIRNIVVLRQAAGAGGNECRSRAATGLLPAGFARLPAAIAAPATRAGLDASPPLHWLWPYDVTKVRQERGGLWAAAMATAVNTQGLEVCLEAPPARLLGDNLVSELQEPKH